MSSGAKNAAFTRRVLMEDAYAAASFGLDLDLADDGAPNQG